MYKKTNTKAYPPELKRHIRSHQILNISLCTASVLLFLFGCPIRVRIGSFHFYSAGIPLPLVFLLFGVLGGIFLVGRRLIRDPIEEAVEKECDPDKYLQLASPLFPHMSDISVHFICLNGTYLKGEWDLALGHADFLTQTDIPSLELVGHFGQARIFFLRGEYEAMKQSREGFLEAMGKCEDATSKEQLRYKRSLDLIEFMVALAEENRETIPILSERLECWNPSVSSELQVRYFKGIGAYLTEQFDIAKQHFTFVVEKGQKSGFAPLAQSYLDRLNP